MKKIILLTALSCLLPSLANDEIDFSPFPLLRINIELSSAPIPDAGFELDNGSDTGIALKESVHLIKKPSRRYDLLGVFINQNVLMEDAIEASKL